MAETLARVHTHTHGNLIEEKVISVNNALLMINKR